MRRPRPLGGRMKSASVTYEPSLPISEHPGQSLGTLQLGGSLVLGSSSSRRDAAKPHALGGSRNSTCYAVDQRESQNMMTSSAPSEAQVLAVGSSGREDSVQKNNETPTLRQTAAELSTSDALCSRSSLKKSYVNEIQVNLALLSGKSCSITGLKDTASLGCLLDRAACALQVPSFGLRAYQGDRRLDKRDKRLRDLGIQDGSLLNCTVEETKKVYVHEAEEIEQMRTDKRNSSSKSVQTTMVLLLNSDGSCMLQAIRLNIQTEIHGKGTKKQRKTSESSGWEEVLLGCFTMKASVVSCKWDNRWCTKRQHSVSSSHDEVDVIESAYKTERLSLEAPLYMGEVPDALPPTHLDIRAARGWNVSPTTAEIERMQTRRQVEKEKRKAEKLAKRRPRRRPEDSSDDDDSDSSVDLPQLPLDYEENLLKMREKLLSESPS